MAGGVEYHCRDTNPLVIAADAAMQQMYQHTKEVSFDSRGSEIDPPEGYFDLVLTSPPYWKVEKYQGEKSSYKLFKKFDDWMEGFLFPMVDNSLLALNKNGVLALNVSDVYANHTYNRIVAPILAKYDHLEPKVMGYKMAKRVGSKSMKDGVFAEPIIVIRKGEER